MDNEPFEDVFPIENGDFPSLCWFARSVMLYLPNFGLSLPFKIIKISCAGHNLDLWISALAKLENCGQKPSGWLNQPIRKTCSSNWIISNLGRGDNKKHVKPPPKNTSSLLPKHLMFKSKFWRLKSAISKARRMV